MSYNILLVVVLWCTLGPVRSDVINDAIKQGQDVYDKTKDYIEGNSTADSPGTNTNTSQSEDPPLLTNNNNGLSNSADDNADNSISVNDNTQGMGVWCWECTVHKSLDNNIVSMYDEVTHTKITTGVCKEYKCAAGLDWCLVTHFRIRSTQGGPESKRERHECGNSNQRERDTRCQALLEEDRDHQVIESCTTKRSGAPSIYTVYISVLLAIVILYIH